MKKALRDMQALRTLAADTARPPQTNKLWLVDTSHKQTHKQTELIGIQYTAPQLGTTNTNFKLYQRDAAEIWG